MGKQIDDTVVEIYLLSDGKKVSIENLHYTMKRETEPLYTMGSPMPRVMISGPRQLTGSFEITPENKKKLRLRHFDIYINCFDDNRTVYIKDVEMLHSMHMTEDGNYTITFIASDLSSDVLKRLEDMSNRELAKQLLEKEY